MLDDNAHLSMTATRTRLREGRSPHAPADAQPRPHRTAPESLDAVYIAYWSFSDPLFQSQSLPVARGLSKSGWHLALVTFEQPAWRLPREEKERVKQELIQEGIRWYPLAYHKRPPVLSTFLDIVAGVLACLVLALTHRARAFHGRGTVPGAIAYISAKLARARFLNDADGPLSQEYVDAGIWRPGSPPHRLVSWFEERCLRAADLVAVLTESRRREVRHLTRAEVTVLPCAVDLDYYAPAPEKGRRIREELGLTGRVLVYVGKTGALYPTEPMMDFAAAVQRVAGGVSLLVLTADSPERFLEVATERGVQCVVRRVSREQIPSYLSAAEAGLSFVLSVPSARARSPIKNGEYLACGLPVVTTPGIGDYSEMIARERVGVVVPDLNPMGMQRAATALASLLRESQLRRRCRAVARQAVGFREVVLPRYLEIYERLLRPVGREKSR